MLQGVFDCTGGSSTSFFELPNEGGSGQSTSATFSYSNTDCNDVVLDCAMSINIQGPELNTLADCGTYFPAALPVELEKFSSTTINDGSVLLEWSTKSEISFSHFVVETSNDLRSWRSAGKVDAENKFRGSNYNFEYRQSLQNNYVRLKMVDLDGSFEYSDFLFIANEQSEKLAIYPNPTSDVLYISGTNANQVAIINNLGQPSIYTLSSQGSIDVSALQPGSYIIRDINGNSFDARRFVKL